MADGDRCDTWYLIREGVWLGELIDMRNHDKQQLIHVSFDCGGLSFHPNDLSAIRG